MKVTRFAMTAICLTSLAIGTTSAEPGSRPDLGIASGQPSGTNWPMAEDIKKVCTTSSTRITNVESEGSLDNIFKVYGDKKVQYGVVQEDALVYQQGLDPKMMGQILMVFPFFSTEMHIIVRDDSSIKSLDDLAGKRVVEGPEGSGTWVSTQVIKGKTGLSWTPLYMSQQDGLTAVQTGKADAEFIVAGMPIGLLLKAQGVRLLPLANTKLDGFSYYTKTMIPSGTYPFQKTSVGTYKVDNVLATFAFKNQYHEEISALVTCITKNIGKMQADTRSIKEGGYHPKWKDVDPLDINRIKWPSHPAAKKAILAAAKQK